MRFQTNTHFNCDCPIDRPPPRCRLWLKWRLNDTLIMLGLAAQIALGPTVAGAGQIYGQITHNNRPVANEGPIHVTCPNNTKSSEADTDDFGSYKVLVRAEGRCTLHMVYRDDPLEHPVHSYREPTRYNFELVRDANIWKLKRR